MYASSASFRRLDRPESAENSKSVLYVTLGGTSAEMELSLHLKP